MLGSGEPSGLALGEASGIVSGGLVCAEVELVKSV